jgi:superfamily II DNA or RNA helicase
MATMRVLHGIWADNALCLWAEALPSAGALPASAVPGASAHPFACQPPELGELLAPAGELARKAVDRELTLALPTASGAPRPAPELDPRPRRAKLALRPWRVPALAFDPASALELLADSDLPDEDVIADAAIGYLAAVATFASGLAVRGRVLPVLSSEAGGYAARWHPVLAAADARHAADLAAAMPPSCRAADPDAAPEALLAATLGALADATARTRLRTPGAARPASSSSLLPARRGRTPARVPLAERYVAALTSTDALVEAATARDQAEAAALAAELTAWLDSARMPSGPVRTCFRLAEPGDEAEAWRVEFALQSTQDPSLMLSAADAWAGAATLGSGDPVEQLLAGLGGAARLFPELGDALHEAAPCELALDTPGAFRFLKQTGPLLAGAGFGVLLPDWVRKARLGLKLTTRSKRPGSGTSAVTPAALGMTDLVDFRYDLALGDQTLDAAELAELARLKVPLVRVRGQWVELDDAHLAAALRFLERNPPGTMTAADALDVGMHGIEEVPLAAVDADGWLGDLMSGQADRRLAPVAAPSGFTGTLRPYQERGLAWLSFLGGLGLGGILADDMGLGKTIQLLALVAARAGPDGPTLLVCPMSLVGNWQREAARFTPDLRVHVHHGADRLDGEDLTAALAGADLVITTYGVVTRDRAALAEVSWARVVCDEAQNIKNHATRQAQAVRALPARARIALTGTPVENRLGELWSIMDFTNPGLLGSAAKFRQRYAIPVERHADADATESLKRLTRPFCLRRVKTDKSIISDLPDKQEMKVWCNLTAEQASLYQATVDDMMARIEAAEEGIERRGLVLATMAKLKQVCNHPAHLLGDGSRLPGRSGKLARLEEICDEIVAEGDKALCFTQYAEFGHMLRPHLAARLGCPVLFLHGGTSKRQRDELVTSFAELDEPAVFLLSLKAGGTGLNLTAASHVIHVDRWWNPAVEDQATDRAFRIGQRRNVQVRKFVCVGTLEERIDAMIEEKKALAERIVGTGESWLADLSVADLREVLTLSPGAVSE